MKTKIFILMLFTALISKAQSTYYLGAYADPAVLIDKDRVGGGNLNFMVKAGAEANGFTASVFYERFNEIAFQAAGLNLGLYKRWTGWELLGIDISGLTTSVSFEQGFISRKGILDVSDTVDYANERYTPFYIGGNLSVRYQITKSIGVEYIVQFRQRPDKNYFFNQTGQNTLSGFVGLVYVWGK